MSIEANVNDILKRFDTVGDTRRVGEAVKMACLLVEREARMKAPKGGGDDGGGENLRGSITSEVNGLTGKVFSPLEYAPFVEFGTGKHAEGGKGRQEVPWVYVTNSAKRKGTGRKDYTEETAQEAVAYLKSKGLDAHMTYGQKPRPFLIPALTENREEILRMIEEAAINDD
jgi:HK97 gp10 family phage protein